MKRLLIILAALVPAVANAHADETRKIDFPPTRSGELVLVVDPHTHSVFSDGHVWPTARVWEAEKDGLDAWMVTEHLEYQPHAEDIPHPDRNRSFALASEEAQKRAAEAIVINGAEITRSFPPGHVNAVFLDDANVARVDDAREAIRTAKKAGAFTFWNHSWWTRDFKDGVVKLSTMHRDLIRDGLLDGIEIANGDYFSNEAFQIALDHDLAVIGVSDIHGLIDHDYDIPGGDHRTVTLAIATEKSTAAIKKSFETNRTAALYRHTLYGREKGVTAILSGALTLEKRGYPREGETIYEVALKNASSTPMTLINVGAGGFSKANEVITVPARGQVVFGVNDVSDPKGLKLTFEVVNAYVAPKKRARIVLQ